VRSTDRRARRRDADRRALLEAAERVFSRAGFAGASMRDIAGEAGISVGSVYQYFSSKDDLYLAVLEDVWESYQTAVRPALSESGFDARIRAFTRAASTFFAARRSFLSVYISERSRFTAAFHDRVAQVVERHKRARRRQVTSIMKLGMAEGVLREGDPEMLASAYLGLVSQCHADALAAKHATLPAPEALVSMFCHGVVQRA
jgi:TetR/AcrR family hemagglutinin/protease transcriptional regulator